ncbi:hypothetical protein [Motiliproteus sp. MSK22-1]|uniref:hypothetical protein n=1 Tax=Motiliproteus sp. MSK22-1 TaxID=1897630 RepID=UPI000975E2FC|nr:hypothetical protein [Motiliproteus sp. MSK22-1]OMH38183.1 hypothetical protein BGP75_07955 [Motiliproteus sp. MSK22-1]
MYAEPSSSANLIMIMQSLVLPLAVALFGLLVWWLNRRNIPRATLVIVPFIAIGFWASFSWIQDRLGLPPQQAMDILIPLLLVSVIFELASHWVNLSGLWKVVLSLVAFMGFIIWMLYPILSRADAVEIVLILVSAAILYLVLQISFSNPANSSVSNGVGLYLAAVAAPLFALDGTLKLAQISGALAAGLGVIWLAGLLFSRKISAVQQYTEGMFAVRFVTPMMVTALYVAAHQYADVNPYALLLVCLGIVIVTLIRRWWPIASIWGDNIRVMVLGLLPFAAALWLIWPEESLY